MFFNSSHTFLSMIFGFLRKFWVGVVKNMFPRNIFSRRIFFGKTSKNIFRDQKKIGKKSYEKVNEKWKFRNFEKFSKKIKILKFSFFIDFFIGFFSKIFWSRKIFFRSSSEKLFISKKYFFQNIFYYSNPKFAQESKNHT